MLSHVVLAALVPVILAKPIVPPRNVEAEPTAAADIAGRQVSGELWDQLAGNLFEDLAPSSASMASDAPSVTPFLKRDEESSSTMYSAEATSTASESSSAPVPSASGFSSSCDCIAECADENGPPSDSHLTAAQLTCIQSCAQSCDGDDDKAKKQDLLGSLGLSSLGLRQVAPWNGRIHHSEPPQASAHAESEWQTCMNNCTTHNCQNADIGDKISQCGDTSCEDKCKGFKNEASAEAIFPFPLAKKQFFPPPPGGLFMERPPPSPRKAFSSGDFDFGACMQNCSTHNCQNADIGDNISQCGDTSCEDECRGIENGFRSGIQLVKKEAEAKPPVFGGPAKVKKPASSFNPAPEATTPEMLRSGHHHKKPHHGGKHHAARADAVPAVPAVPGVDGLPDSPTMSASGGAEYDACMSQCRTHNCQSADVGDTISQCGDTSCEQQCRHLHSDAAAAVSVPARPEPWHRPLGPLDAATESARLRFDRENPEPVAGAEENKEFDDCMSQCRSHNCQNADVGGLISQCGDTDCESNCAQFRLDRQAGIVA
ncbi:hypothetical protein GGR52DRAFT_423370 [Hypoxylon sp. FL1284]|nr:hypothetical protein GGR52DRAFT_423370 [Hypoxylon sp. FL1284]